MKLCEAPTLFSGVKAKLTRWLKDLEDFYKLEKVLDLDKVLVIKNRMFQDLKEWFDLYEREGVSDAASQGILLGSVQVPSLDSAETSLECRDSLVEGTLRTRRTMGDSVETSGRGDGGRAEVDSREIAEGLELHSLVHS
uniref:Uncharacterized protein n=1 Tax=Chromera velia CCMP2878 TaxID=1169474 RepID=A0A0G4H9G0_9ALVE|eukprot:Cvel_25275.t1-p1 / transcript=Cvel_25275.t1 / gene=Cvel_25275 / organism=Chromera_velia_CCMP2878 / gene_product=hypothetical protein / transcript_product=hypothetical protein / location=Cvel_scaffold2838:40-955(-) / protein_length=138 / sequence_SO=supercontig / SO=protein_coding / is_pseudo=false